MSVPPVIRSGDDGNLMCLYDLEGEHLYSTRWYKGRREFYRYTPKENPAKKTFPVPGINVEVMFHNSLISTLRFSHSKSPPIHSLRILSPYPTHTVKRLNFLFGGKLESSFSLTMLNLLYQTPPPIKRWNLSNRFTSVIE